MAWISFSIAKATSKLNIERQTEWWVTQIYQIRPLQEQQFLRMSIPDLMCCSKTCLKITYWLVKNNYVLPSQRTVSTMECYPQAPIEL